LPPDSGQRYVQLGERDQFDGRGTRDKERRDLAIANFVSIIDSPTVTTEALESAKHSRYLQMRKHEKVDKRYTRLEEILPRN